MATGRPASAALGIVGEELLYSCVAGEAEGPFRRLRGSLPLQRSLRRCFLALTQAELPPSPLLRIADKLSSAEPEVAARLRELARLYQRYRSLLSAGGVKLDSGLAQVRRLQPDGSDGGSSRGLSTVLAQLGLTVSAAGGGLQIGGLHRLPTWDALPNQYVALATLTQLFPADAAAGASVCLPQLPETGGEPVAAPLDQGLKPLLESLYARHQLGIDIDWQPLGPALRDDALDSAWGRFVSGLFRPASAPASVVEAELAPEQLTIEGQPSPAAEARLCAQRVRDLLDAGVPPGQIGIVVENAARRARVGRALRRYGVPFCLPLDSRSFADSARAELPPPLSLPLQIYELLQQGLPREGWLAVMTSPYLHLPLPDEAADAAALARALRGAGIRALSGSSQEELRRRIREWLRLQRSGRGSGRDAAATANPDEEPVELRQLSLLVAELSSLPAHGSVRQHAQALARLCERFALGPRAQGLAEPIAQDPVDPEAPLTVAERAVTTVAALARDQAAMAVLRRVLYELPLAADALRLAEHGLSRQSFATLLRALCQRLWADSLRQTSAATTADAVQLAGLFDLPVVERRYLFCLGMIEGELPAAATEDPLLSDDERALCNRFLGASVLPLARSRVEAAPLRFAELLAHSQAAQLSYPRADEEGRPLLPSSFVATVLHAAGRDAGAPQPAPGPGADPASRELPVALARHPSELWRFAASAFARPDGGGGLPGAVASTLSRFDRARRGRLLARLSIERARTAWFVALSQTGETDVFAEPAGPHSGQLSDRGLIGELASRLPGDARRPLSASALEDYARCPFRFFVYRVLHAAPIEEGSDDLDPLTNGRLHHRVLEKFFVERRDRGALPLCGAADEREHLLTVIDQVLLEFDERERTGHPTLFRARLRRLRGDLLRLIAHEAQSPIEPGCYPALLEHPFGPLRIAAQNDAEPATIGDDALHIAGVIDRIDIGPGRALVLDYKTGQIRRYQEYLRSELLRTSFQLPLYAAAVQADPQVAARAGVAAAEGARSLQVSARYYAVRQAAVSPALSDEGLFALAGPARAAAGEGNVAEVAYRLWRRLRSGDFRVAPKTCEGCGLESVCRIGSAAVDRLPEAADALESESSSSVGGSGRGSRQSAGWASARTPSSGSGPPDADGESGGA